MKNNVKYENNKKWFLVDKSKMIEFNSHLCTELQDLIRGCGEIYISFPDNPLDEIVVNKSGNTVDEFYEELYEVSANDFITKLFEQGVVNLCPSCVDAFSTLFE